MSLNPCCSRDGLVLVFVVYVIINIAYVLILIVLEDGLVPELLAGVLQGL